MKYILNVENSREEKIIPEDSFEVTAQLLLKTISVKYVHLGRGSVRTELSLHFRLVFIVTTPSFAVVHSLNQTGS